MAQEPVLDQVTHSQPVLFRQDLAKGRESCVLGCRSFLGPCPLVWVLVLLPQLP